MNQYNKNLVELGNAYNNGFRGAILEGGSRSGKTWSSVDFIIWLSLAYNNQTINVIKETYASFKTTLYNDFRQRLDQWPDLRRYNVFESVKEVPTFRLYSTRINFIGADQPSKFHGAGDDFFYVNESLEVSEAIFNQLEMRCKRFWWMDYNPKVTDHWIYDRLFKRDDVKVVYSTMLDNPHISKWERKKIVGYEPTPENIAAGTADEYMWKVYGLGQRAARQGLVFPEVVWVDSFPTDIEQVVYGMDFGYTNSPTAIVKVGRNGQNLWVEKLFYAPVDNASDLYTVIQRLGVTETIWADSADPGMISDLRSKGLRVLAVNKFPGSIKYGIDLMKQHKLHAVRDVDTRKEFENYRWKEVGGISLNEPEDDYNHAIDAARYAILSNFRRHNK